MEREVSSVVSLATSLIAISVVITIVMYTVIIGNGLKEGIFEGTAQVQTQMSNGQLNSLSGGETKVMPKATIYAILSQEHSAINSITYTKTMDIVSGAEKEVVITPVESGNWGDSTGNIISEYIFPEDVMASELSGKVTVEVEKNKYGTYDVTVRNIKIN